MKPQLKPLNEQVIVITGASSGIGLTTALSAAKQGAKVVLAARSKNALDEIVSQIQANGGQALAVECDVADRAAVENLARAAANQFGRIDTWACTVMLPMKSKRLFKQGDFIVIFNIRSCL